MASKLLCVKTLLPSSLCFAKSIIHLGWQLANCSHPLSQDVAAGFFQALITAEHSQNMCKQQEGLAQRFPWQMTPAMLHRRAVLSSWAASREGSWETSPPEFSQGATRRKEILKRAGLQQGVINMFQINEAFFSSSSEMERCGGRECRCTWSCCTWVSSWPPVHLQ